MPKTLAAFMSGFFFFVTLVASETTDANARGCPRGLYGGSCFEPRRAAGAGGTPYFHPLHRGAPVAGRPHYAYQRRVY